METSALTPLLPFNARPKPRFQIVMSCLKPPTEKYYRQFHEICDARMYNIPFSWIYRIVKFRLGHPCQCVRQPLLQLLRASKPSSSAPPPNSKPKPTPLQSVITRHLRFEPASSSEQSRRFRSGRFSFLPSMLRHPSKPQPHPNQKLVF